MNPLATEFDVIIVGAGVNGLMLAGLLSQPELKPGFSVAVIEANAFDTKNKEKQSPDPRVLALTLASKKLFQRINVWDNIPKGRLGCFENMYVWDESGDGHVEFQAQDLAEACLAYSVEGRLLQLLMMEELNRRDNVHFFQPAVINRIEYEQDKAIVSLEDGRHLQTKLVIAADGQRSSVREMAGISYLSESYGQKAMACIVETEKAHENVARQRFLKEGILAFLPMAKANQCAIVWSTETHRAELLQSLDRTEFHNTLGDSFQQVLGPITQSEERVLFPLKSGQAEHYCQQRLALIGDAAHSVHPLAGQGANLGFMDAAVLAETLIKAQQRGSDFGYHAVLRRYERWRRGENIMMMNVFSGFKWLFEQQYPPMPLLRNAGLRLFDHCGPLKHLTMHWAMGLGGDLPEMLRY